MKTSRKKSKLSKRGGATTEQGPYKCLRLHTHQYKNIKYRNLDYCNKAVLFLKDCLKKYNATSTNATSDIQSIQTHLSSHFHNPPNFNPQSEFYKTYGSEIYFLIDPLFNDIDDIIAFLYFVCLSIECNVQVTLYLDCDDIRQVNPGKHNEVSKTLDALIALTNIIIKKAGNTSIELIKFEHSKLPATKITPFEKTVPNPGIEYMLASFKSDIDLSDTTGITISIDKQSVPGKPEPGTVSLGGADPSNKDLVTVFVLRGVGDHSIQLIDHIKPNHTVNVIANGADIFSNEDGSCPSNVRFGTKIQESDNSIRDLVFQSYINFVEKCNNFYCFPLKRQERPFTVEFEEAGETIISKTSVSASDSPDQGVGYEKILNDAFIDIRNELTQIKTDLYNLGDLCFPDKDNGIVQGGCEAYKSYGSFLIDMITVMHAPLGNEPLEQRTLCLFTESIDLSLFKTKQAIETYSDEQLAFQLDNGLLDRLYTHSKEALFCCYNQSADELGISPARASELLADSKIKKYTKYLSKTPSTLESSVLNVAFIPKHHEITGDVTVKKVYNEQNINVDLINPECTILATTVRNKLNTPNATGIVRDVVKTDFAIIEDRNDTLIGGSIGPNGVLQNCNGGKYGRYRMNTFYKNDEETFKLIDDFIQFRNSKKLDVFNLYVTKLSKSGETNKSIEQYIAIIQLLYQFYSWAIDQYKDDVLTTLGLDIKSRCQTWIRHNGDTPELLAHNTIPVPHFQTFFYITNEDKYNQALNAFFNSSISETNNAPKLSFDEFLNKFNENYIKLMYFFTRSMRDGYGMSDALTISKGGVPIAVTEPEKVFNGRAFVDLDAAHELIKMRPRNQVQATNKPDESPEKQPKEPTPQFERSPSKEKVKIVTYNVLEGKVAGFSIFTTQDIRPEHIQYYNDFIRKFNIVDDYFTPLSEEIPAFTKTVTSGNGTSTEIRDTNKEANYMLVFNKIRELKIIGQIYISLKQDYIVTLQEVRPEFSYKLVNILNQMGLKTNSFYCRGTLEFSKYMSPMIITTKKIDHKFYFYCHNSLEMGPITTGYIKCGYEDNKTRFRLGYTVVLACFIEGCYILTTHFPGERKDTQKYIKNIDYCLTTLGLIGENEKIIFTSDFNNNINDTIQVVGNVSGTIANILKDPTRLLNGGTDYTTHSSGKYFNNARYGNPRPGEDPATKKIIVKKTPKFNKFKLIQAIMNSLILENTEIPPADIDRINKIITLMIQYDNNPESLKQDVIKKLFAKIGLSDIDTISNSSQLNDQNIGILYNYFSTSKISDFQTLLQLDGADINNIITDTYEYMIPSTKDATLKSKFCIKSIDGIWTNIAYGSKTNNTRVNADTIDLQKTELPPDELNYEIDGIDTRTLNDDTRVEKKSFLEEFNKYDGPNLDYQYSDHICVKVEFTTESLLTNKSNNVKPDKVPVSIIAQRVALRKAEAQQAPNQQTQQAPTQQAQNIGFRERMRTGKLKNAEQKAAKNAEQKAAKNAKSGGSIKKRGKRTKKKRN